MVRKLKNHVFISSVKMLLVLMLALLCSLLINELGVIKESLIMVFLLGILFVTILTRGYIYGLIASVISVMMFNFFFTAPHYTFLIYSSSDVMLLVFFLVTAIVSGTVTSRLQKQISISSHNEMTARLLYEVAGGFVHVTGRRNIVMHGISDIRKNTGFESMVMLEDDSIAYYDENRLKKDALDTDGVTLQIQGVSRNLGAIKVLCDGNSLSLQQDLILKTVATQLGIALDRENSYNDRENIRIAMEREKLRSTLLRSIAHDLRSPLTALTGASALLADEQENLSLEERKKLATDISEEMVWLNNLVENILNMTRISEGQLILSRQHEVVDDVVNEALSHMSRFLQNRHIEVSLPDEVVTLPMDGKLIAQVLINLLDNAVKHTPPNTNMRLKVYVKDDRAFFEVSDTGGGIDVRIYDTLFDGFVTLESHVTDSKRGIGLGLAICKAVVEGHGGNIEVQNRDGGARFVFSLPMEEPSDEQP